MAFRFFSMEAYFMNQSSRILRTLGLVVSVVMAALPFADIAASAVAPDVMDLPAITQEIDVPVRFVRDSSGNLYVTNPRYNSILKYNNAGVLIQKIVTSKSGGGIAIAQNGNLLVTQGTYVAVLDPATGAQINTLRNAAGTLTQAFTYANGIAVDPTGNIYVSDSRAFSIRKFGPTYNLLIASGASFRPAGLAYEKQSNQLVVANSTAGTVLMLNPATLAIAKTIGAIGYDATNATLKFTNPQGVALEYDASGTTLDRIYVADGYQATIRVLDGQNVLSAATPVGTVSAAGIYLADIGGYGFIKGKIFAPSDVLIDQADPANKRVFVANGGGNLTIFGIDRNMQPKDVQVINPMLASLTVQWQNPASFSKIRVYSSDVNGVKGTQLAELTGGETSYVHSGLGEGTIYYYLVRAVDAGGTESANNQSVFGKTRQNFDLALSTIGGLGAGTINGTYSVGENSSTTVAVLDNTLVTLTASPNTLTSVFDGWTGDCAAAGLNESCVITMDSVKSVTANFDAQWPFLVDGWLYRTLHDAYQSTEPSLNVIEAMTGTWPAKDFTDYIATADRPITVTIKGGYDSEFTGQLAGKTTVITGRVNVKSGKVIMNNIKIKP